MTTYARIRSCQLRMSGGAISEHLGEVPHTKRRTFEPCPGRVNALGNLSVNRSA